MAKSSLEKTIQKQIKQAKDAQRKQERAMRESAKQNRASAIVNGQPLIDGFRIMDETSEIMLQCLLACERSDDNRINFDVDIFPSYVKFSIGVELEKLIQYGMIGGLISYDNGGICYLLPPAITYFENKKKVLDKREIIQNEPPERKRLKKLIEHGQAIKVTDAKITSSDCAKWNQDVRTFKERVLKEHPANKPITDALFFCNIDSILGCLQSVYEDLEFWDESYLEGSDVSMIPAKNFAEYDVFVSHANKDKSSFVNDLKVSLDKLGISVFYDKDSLTWGDNWKTKILQGVQQAEFAIIVISENFFGREWTEKELDEFLSRQNTDGQKIILPILYGITVEELKEKYPAVAEIQAINASDYSYDEIALMFANQLIKRLKK